MSAVVIEGVSKKFRLTHERNNSFKAAAMRGRRAIYEDFWALRDVSFEIPEATTFGIIGANGSGKSTLLKILANILRPDTGRVQVNGRLSALLELGAGFHPELSGRENVFLNASILGFSPKDIKTRFDDIVGFAGLEQFIDEPVKNYSSGMYVRLGFSVAINVDPEILLVDEVLGVGDQAFQQRCAEKFADFRRDGKTIIVVSHALDRMRTMCHEVAWLDKGNLRMVGAVGDIVNEYVIESQEQERGEYLDDQRRLAAELGATRREDGSEQLISGLELIDEKGRVVRSVASGGPARIRVKYDAGRIGEPVTVALGIYRNDGAHVASINAGEAFHGPEYAEGSVTVEYDLERLPLLPGTYEVSVALHDAGVVGVFERQDRALRIDVHPTGEHLNQFGLVFLGGAWSATPSTQLTAAEEVPGA